METPIGQRLRSGGGRLRFTVAVSFIVVGCDLALVTTGYGASELRYAFAALVVVFFGTMALVARDGTSYGFRLTPVQGWVYWIKMAARLGLIMLAILSVFAVIVFGILRYRISESYHYVTQSSQVTPLFVGMCITAPLLEEVVFRLAICPPAAAWLGPKAAIAISGIAFAGLHVLYGNPAPDNLIAGFILAWAYLKSGTLVLPIALHSLGNLCAFAYHAGYFYFH